MEDKWQACLKLPHATREQSHDADAFTQQLSYIQWRQALMTLFPEVVPVTPDPDPDPGHDPDWAKVFRVRRDT